MPNHGQKKSPSVRAEDGMGNTRLFPTISDAARHFGLKRYRMVRLLETGDVCEKTNLRFYLVEPKERCVFYNINIRVDQELKEAMLKHFHAQGKTIRSANKWLTDEVERMLRQKFASLGKDTAAL